MTRDAVRNRQALDLAQSALMFAILEHLAAGRTAPGHFLFDSLVGVVGADLAADGVVNSLAFRARWRELVDAGASMIGPNDRPFDPDTLALVVRYGDEYGDGVDAAAREVSAQIADMTRDMARQHFGG